MTSFFRLHKNLIIEILLLIAASFSIIIAKINVYYLIFTIAIHELGHIIAAFSVGAKAHNFNIHGFGVEINFPGKNLPLNKLGIISAGGPIFSLITALIAYKTNAYPLCFMNISIGIINLIPTNPLDGGNIFYYFMSKTLSRKKAKKILNILGKFFGLFLTFCGLLMFYTFSNISLIFLGVLIFFSSSAQYNPVTEITSQEQEKFKKSTIYIVDSNLSDLEIADELPANSIGALTNEKGEILSFVTPLELYEKELKK